MFSHGDPWLLNDSRRRHNVGGELLLLLARAFPCGGKTARGGWGLLGDFSLLKRRGDWRRISIGHTILTCSLAAIAAA